MRHKNTKTPAALALALLAGCAASPFNDSYEAQSNHDVGPLSSVEKRAMERADALEAYSSDADELSPATIHDFVRLAEARNPRILAAQQRALRYRERVPQVSSLDDPMLQITPVGEMAETAAGQVDVMAGVSQRIPYPGKLSARGRIAGREADAASEEINQVRRAVIAETRRAYWSFYYAVRALEITEQSRTLLTQMYDIAQAQYRAGGATQDAVLRAAVERNGVENQVIELTQRRESAAAMLNMLIDCPQDAPIPEPPAVRASPIDERLDALVESARQNAPGVLALRARLEQGRAQRELARLNRLPDLTVNVAYNWVEDDGLSPVANGDDQWWVGFGVNLPIWQGRNRAAEREATRSMLETAGQLASEQNRAAYLVHDAVARLESQQRQIALLEDSILPDARQSVESSLSGFRAGAVSFITVIDNWRTLLDLELTLASSVVSLETAFADLEQAVGRDVARADAVEEASHE